MGRVIAASLLVGVVFLLPSVTQSTNLAAAGPQARRDPERKATGPAAIRADELTESGRLAFIRSAQVWMPTDIPNMNLREGPRGAGQFQPNELVICDYVDEPRHGTSPKFSCVLAGGDIVKVRYGANNGEVPGSVLATRLLWALGFAADRVYPVRVKCHGCSADPWNSRGHADQINDFEPAVIERKPAGHEMSQDKKRPGWAWTELDLVDEEQGGAPQAHRDALKLLAVLMQHTDSRSQQQRLLCLPGGLTSSGQCEKPFLMLHDVGKTFGHANIFNRMGPGSVNFDAWARTPVWSNRTGCVGHLSKSFTGTLGSPHISEAGRQFLAQLLRQLTDQQIYDLFEIAGVAQRTVRVTGGRLSPSVEDWVAAFKSKRDQIATRRCAG